MTSSPYTVNQFQTSNGQTFQSSQVYTISGLALVGAAVSIDLKPLINLHRIGNIQGIYLDNSAGTVALTVSTVVGQNIIIPAGYQGVMPLYLSPDGVVTFNGNGTISANLLNFPTPANVWPAGASSSLVQQVQDAALEALIYNGGYMVNQGGFNVSDVRQNLHYGKSYYGQNFVGGTVIAGVAGKYPFVNNIAIDLACITTGTVQSTLTIAVLFSTAGGILLTDVPILTTAPTSSPNPVVNLSGLNLIGNSGDSVTISTTLGSGSLNSGGINFCIVGGLTSIP